MKSLITLEQIRGVCAMLPTPSTEQASEPDAPFSVDLAETERATRALIAGGVGAIMTNGSLGEMATLSYEEWKAFNQVVVETAKGAKPDLPVFVGVTTLGTRNTISLARDVLGFGGEGIFVGRPFWCPLDGREMVDFYQSLAGAVSDLSICIYDNPDAFKGQIPTAVYEQISHLPQMVASKYIALTPKFNQDVAAVADRMHLLPLEVDWFTAKAMWPDRVPACWSSSVACGPKPVIALASALDKRDFDQARDITKRIARTYETFLAARNWPEFTKYNIPLEKIRFNEAGFMKSGPARHPYQNAPQEYLDGSIKSARRWKKLCEEFTREEARQCRA